MLHNIQRKTEVAEIFICLLLLVVCYMLFVAIPPFSLCRGTLFFLSHTIHLICHPLTDGIAKPAGINIVLQSGEIFYLPWGCLFIIGHLPYNMKTFRPPCPLGGKKCANILFCESMILLKSQRCVSLLPLGSFLQALSS